VKWFCRQLNFNELSSVIVIFHEVLSGIRSDIELRPDDNPPHYRKFKVDRIPPLLNAPKPEKPELTSNWRELLRDYKDSKGKKLKPVFRHAGKVAPPSYCRCECCDAPSDYLSFNNGKDASQVRCKVCKGLSSIHKSRVESKAKLWCPYCGYALFKWKEDRIATVFKCPNYKCSHYLKNESLLNSEEAVMREACKYNPNFKLHYQFRELKIDLDELQVARPELASRVDFRKIHNNSNVVGLVLSYSINLGLSSRQTRDALKFIHKISISHQTVLNYMEASAGLIYEYVDKNAPLPKGKAAADETYIIVDGKWHYTWFIIDSSSRAICGFNLSDNRGNEPALALLNQTFGSAKNNHGQFDLITDGNPSYDNAVMLYNQDADKEPLTKYTVIGLENLNEESKEYRQFKQIVERLNRTYKFHTRPRSGFKTFSGAVILTVLFVAFYNFMRPHTGRNGSPPVVLEELANVDTYQHMWMQLLKSA